MAKRRKKLPDEAAEIVSRLKEMYPKLLAAEAILLNLTTYLGSIDEPHRALAAQHDEIAAAVIQLHGFLVRSEFHFFINTRGLDDPPMPKTEE